MAINNTSSEDAAKREAYVRGRNDENYVQKTVRSQERANAQRRVDESASSGVLVGMMIALLAAGVGAALYFLTGDRSNVVPVAAPQIEREVNNTEKETTIIEREVSVPDVSLPDVQVDIPDVNITNESPEPATAPEPIAEPAAESESVAAPAAAE
ncbi:MAG: hypothetical protein AAFP03_03820 [Cyanobacteria bacterium J06598_3]